MMEEGAAKKYSLHHWHVCDRVDLIASHIRISWVNPPHEPHLRLTDGVLFLVIKRQFNKH